MRDEAAERASGIVGGRQVGRRRDRPEHAGVARAFFLPHAGEKVPCVTEHDKTALQQDIHISIVPLCSARAPMETKGDNVRGADAKSASVDAGSLDGPEPERVLALVAEGGEGKADQTILLPYRTAIVSSLVQTMADADPREKTIPLPNVKLPVLRKIVEWMQQHAGAAPVEIEKPLKSANMAEVVSAWDAQFVDVPQDLLFELIMGANYLDIKALLDLVCAKVASMIKGDHARTRARTHVVLDRAQAGRPRRFVRPSTSKMTSRPRKRRLCGPRTSGRKSRERPPSSDFCKTKSKQNPHIQRSR